MKRYSYASEHIGIWEDPEGDLCYYEDAAKRIEDSTNSIEQLTSELNHWRSMRHKELMRVHKLEAAIREHKCTEKISYGVLYATTEYDEELYSVLEAES